MNIFLIAVIITMVIYLVIGWYVGRKVKSLDDYYVAGRNAPTLVYRRHASSKFYEYQCIPRRTGNVLLGARSVNYYYDRRKLFRLPVRRSLLRPIPASKSISNRTRIFREKISKQTPSSARWIHDHNRFDMLLGSSHLGYRTSHI